MEKTIIYCRVSTEEQANKGLSLDVQERACLKKAEELGLSCIEIIRDEGKSAGTMNRPGLQKMLGLCSEGKIKNIIAIHSDRIARNTADHLMMRKLFEDKGIRVVYALQPGMDNSTAFGQTMDTMMAAFNEMQRLVIKEKTKGALLEKVKEGWHPGVAPLGYVNVDNPNFRKGEISRRIVVPDPNIAPLVEEMFELYAQGDCSVYTLAEEMKKRGLISRKGKMLHPSKVYETLRNPFYIGQLEWGGIVIKKAKHRPIIDEQLFAEVNQVLDAHNHHACRKRRYHFLLRGFAFCEVCGRRFTSEWHTKPSGLKFGYYHCPTSGCPNAYNEIGEMEEKIKEQFKVLQFSEEFIAKVVERTRKILDEKRKQIASKNKLYQNRKNSLEVKRCHAEDKLLKGVLSDADFTRIRQSVREGLEEVESQLALLEKQRETKIDEIQEILRFSRNIYASYDQASYILKRHYLNLFWDKFYIKDQKIIKAAPTPLFQALIENKQVIINTKWGDQRDSNPCSEFHRFWC